MAKKKIVNNNIEEESSKEQVNQSFSNSNVYYSIAIIIVLLFAAYLRSRFFDIPFERDEGTYTYYGQLMLDGKPLYTSFDAMKFPGIYYAYAAIIGIFGKTIKAVHFGFLLLNLITIFWVTKCAEYLFDKTTAILSGLSFALISLAPQISGFSVQSEHMIAFFASGAFLFALKSIKENNFWHSLLSGLLIGAALMIKQSAVFYILFIGIYMLIELVTEKPIVWKRSIYILGMYSVGVFIPFIIGCLVVLKQGVWEDFIFWTLEYPKSYASQIGWEQGKQLLTMTFERILKDYKFFWYLPFVGLISSLFVKEFNFKKKLFFWMLAIFAFLTVAPGLRFYGHYWLQLTPAIALLMGLAVYSIRSIILKFYNKEREVTIAVFALFIMFIGSHLSTKKEYYFNPDYTKVLRQVYGMNPFPEAKAIGDYIGKRTKDGDKILVLGSEPQIHFYSDRRSPSRHAYAAHLVGLHPDHKIWQKELIADVEADMPTYVVFFDHSVSWLFQKGADTGIFDWYNKFINKNYKLVGIVDMVSPMQTVYAWDENVKNYKPKSKFKIYVYKKKQ